MYEAILRRLVGDDYNLVGDEAVLLCPVHEARTGHPDHTPSFYFNIESGLCICFSCNYRANAHQLWTDIRGDVLEDIPVPDEDEGIRELQRRLDRISVEPVDIPTIMSEADFRSFSVPTTAMLKSRGISPSVAMRLDIRSSESAWVVPIRHIATNILMGIQVKDQDYVRNLPRGVKKGMGLFGLSTMDLTLPTLIVESPLDVAVCLTHGVQAIATYGASVTNDQLAVIKGMPSPILAFDNDHAGRAIQDQVEQALLTLCLDVRRVMWPKGVKDPGDMGAGIRDVETVSVLDERLHEVLNGLD